MDVILGVVVSLLVQGIKKYFGTDQYITLVAVAVLSLGGALIFTGIQAVGFWPSFAHILEVAGAFYAFIILRFNGATSTPAVA